MTAAAALLEMVAAYAGADAAGAADRAAALREQLLEAGEAELTSYEPVLAATRLQPGDPSRDRRLREALSRACDGPIAIARAAAETAERLRPPTVSRPGS